jgi:hypothetical protein
VLTLRDIGVWAHYIGDAAQPLHDTVHYNGWDSAHYPNPKGFTNDRIHGPFEEDFVRDHITIEMVRAKLPAPREGGPIDKRTIDYVATGGALVEPLYQMWKDGDFLGAAPKGVDFTVTRLAAGSAELRDLVTSAWHDSATATIGYRESEISPAQAASGERDPWLALYGMQHP